ncbi:MAG TPA: pentapeptide repeat-containing protein [Solirubrobacteraceae bacterium]|jgi:uncharacterized protein YjbI with pentapeptide repeats
MHDQADAPRTPDLPTELKLDADPEVVDGAKLEALELFDCDLSARWARNVFLEACRLKGVDLSESRLEQGRMTDVCMEGTNLANLHAVGMRAVRVELESCRLTGVNLNAGQLTDLHIRSCKVDLATFATARLERVTFEDCQLAGSDFLDAELDSVRFQGCDMTGVDLRGARLRACELRRCELADIRGVGSLRGAALEWATIVELAGVWAETLGIEVLDRD